MLLPLCVKTLWVETFPIHKPCGCIFYKSSGPCLIPLVVKASETAIDDRSLPISVVNCGDEIAITPSHYRMEAIP